MRGLPGTLECASGHSGEVPAGALEPSHFGGLACHTSAQIAPIPCPCHRGWRVRYIASTTPNSRSSNPLSSRQLAGQKVLPSFCESSTPSSHSPISHKPVSSCGSLLVTNPPTWVLEALSPTLAQVSLLLFRPRPRMTASAP